MSKPHISLQGLPERRAGQANRPNPDVQSQNLPDRTTGQVDMSSSHIALQNLPERRIGQAVTSDKRIESQSLSDRRTGQPNISSQHNQMEDIPNRPTGQLATSPETTYTYGGRTYRYRPYSMYIPIDPLTNRSRGAGISTKPGGRTEETEHQEGPTSCQDDCQGCYDRCCVMM